MRKIMFVGRSESGKTTIMQAMKGEKIVYHKTQYINHYDVVIDTLGCRPGAGGRVAPHCRL